MTGNNTMLPRNNTVKEKNPPNVRHKSDITSTDVLHCHWSKGNLKITSGLSEDDKLVSQEKTQ